MQDRLMVIEITTPGIEGGAGGYLGVASRCDRSRERGAKSALNHLRESSGTRVLKW